MFKSDKIGFSRQERSAIIFLIVILFAGLITTYFKDIIHSQHANTLTHEDSLVLDKFSFAADVYKELSPVDDSCKVNVPVSEQLADGGLININNAGVEELQTLPGIGPVLAERIVEYRKKFGPYEAPDSLINVRGIGEVKLKGILSKITNEIPRREN